MRFFAITNKATLATEYLGIHPSQLDAWVIFLGWPTADELGIAKMKYACEEVAIYPLAQACRTTELSRPNGETP